MNKTSIEWTSLSANPIKYRRKSDNKVVWGCVKTSAGCAHCYSEALALRFNRGKLFNSSNMEELTTFLDEDECRSMRTKKMCDGVLVSGSRCFVSDMTDLFGEWVSDDILNRLFSGTLEIRTDVTWQILTKRSERMHKYLSWRWGEGRIVPKNIHVGVSVENQKAADERIPLLLQTPAAVRFLSCEPLLGPVYLTRLFLPDQSGFWNALDGRLTCKAKTNKGQEFWAETDKPISPHVDLVIIGGESGHGARPCDLSWIRSLIAQCKAASVSVFVKQLGKSYFSGDSNHTHYFSNDKKGGNMEEWPIDLRIRDLPC